MKTKTLHIMLALLLLVGLGAVVAPVGDVKTAQAAGVSSGVYGGFGSYNLADYDVRWVSLLGADGGAFGDGSETYPWQTITYAEDQLPYVEVPDLPDLIVVMATGPNWYGGANPENIYIEEPVVIVSEEGAGVTTLDVSAQGDETPQVAIEIVSSDVTIDGLEILGAQIGILAWPNPADYIERVNVYNCDIKVIDCDWGTGIDMLHVKYPVIDGNTIYVLAEGEPECPSTNATGIHMYDCFQSQVTNNDIDVYADFLAVGIDMELCPKSLVGVLPNPTPAPNEVTVTADGDVIGIGIKVKDCPLIDVMYNIVSVTANGNHVAIAYGIKVKESDRADVISNTVTVTTNLMGDFYGFMKGRGIYIKHCHETNVNYNNVTLNSSGIVNSSNEVMPPDKFALADEDLMEDMADLEILVFEALGIDQCFTQGMGTLVGISVKGSWMVTVLVNTVDVNLNIALIDLNSQFSAAFGGGCAIGIDGLGTPMIYVGGNTVDVESNVTANLGSEGEDCEASLCDVNSVAMGIILKGADGSIVGNDVAAHATNDATVVSLGVTPTYSVPEGEGSALDRFDSIILSGIYQQLSETLESEEVNIPTSLGMPGLQSFAAGGGMAAGMGILVMGCGPVSIENNSPVTGTGNMTVTILSEEEWVDDMAMAMGNGLGLGVGIAVVDSMSAKVNNNRGVSGTGTADVSISAVHGNAPMVMDSVSMGGGAGIGLGILLVGSSQYRPMEGTEEELGAEWFVGFKTEVTNNTVSASGIACPVYVSAVDYFDDHCVLASGCSLAVAIGIGVAWYPCVLIGNNEVIAIADACVETDAVGQNTFDPMSIGSAEAFGIGIVVIDCFGAKVLDNTTLGQATASGYVAAEELYVLESHAFGSSTALGVGVLVGMTWFGTISGNHATGLGDAECDVLSESEIPLQWADAWSLANGMGKGIAVLCSPCTSVIRCNTAAGEGTARVSAEYIADFGFDFALGFAASYDILMKLYHGCGFGVVNYNSIVDAEPLGVNEGPILVMDAGLLKIGHYWLDATLNWWNEPTGPSGMGPGIVKEYAPGKFHPEPVIWYEWPPWERVRFSPWLYVEHYLVLEEQIGKFGFFIPMSKGLNTFSTPIALEDDVVPSRTWEDILTNSDLIGKIKPIQRWTGTAWAGVLMTDLVEPLEAYYIYMLYPGENIILFVSSEDSMPVRNLPAGWSLIGPNPLFGQPGMFVKHALSSIEQTSAALPGYTQVISPIVWGQLSWIFTPDMFGPGPWMQSGRGYWVWMENPDILVGFGFTPLPAGP